VLGSHAERLGGGLLESSGSVTTRPRIGGRTCIDHRAKPDISGAGGPAPKASNLGSERKGWLMWWLPA